MAPNEIWHDATPDSSVELASVLTQKLVTEDIIQTVATESISSGRLDYYCVFYPLSADSNVVAT